MNRKYSSSLLIFELLLHLYSAHQFHVEDIVVPHESYEDDNFDIDQDSSEMNNYGYEADKDYTQNGKNSYDYRNYGSGYETGGYSKPIGMADIL